MNIIELIPNHRMIFIIFFLPALLLFIVFAV